MNQYESLKRANIKFPMTEKMFNYYISLGLNCCVIKYHSRMDGSINVVPGIIYSDRNLLDCMAYDFVDREDIRKILLNQFDHFYNKYKERCIEIFERQLELCK